MDYTITLLLNILHLGPSIICYKIIYTGIYIHGVTRCDCIKFRMYTAPRGIVNIPLSPTFHSYLRAYQEGDALRMANEEKSLAARSVRRRRITRWPKMKIPQGRRIPRIADRWSVHIDGAKYLDRMSPYRSVLHINLTDACQIDVYIVMFA